MLNGNLEVEATSKFYFVSDLKNFTQVLFVCNKMFLSLELEARGQNQETNLHSNCYLDDWLFQVNLFCVSFQPRTLIDQFRESSAQFPSFLLVLSVICERVKPKFQRKHRVQCSLVVPKYIVSNISESKSFLYPAMFFGLIWVTNIFGFNGQVSFFAYMCFHIIFWHD